MDYWKECILQAFDDAGIIATDKQVSEVAEAVEGSHENYGLATGQECIPNPLQTECDSLKRELRKEQDKEFCLACDGKGSITEKFGPIGRTSTSSCMKCNGRGFIY